RGEIEIGITGEANIAMLLAEGWPVAAIYPSEGTGLRFDAMGIIAGGPNPESARVFMDWATSLANHEIAARHFRRSVRADAPAPDVPLRPRPRRRDPRRDPAPLRRAVLGPLRHVAAV